MLCNTKKIKDVSVVSPYGRRWHVHVKLLQSQDNKKRFKKVLFLNLASKIWKIILIISNIIPPKLKFTPYYIDPGAYIDFQVQITKKRINNSDYRRLLFIKQRGICCHCSTPLVSNEYNLVNDDIVDSILDLDSQTEIHHVTSIAVGMSAGLKKHVQLNKLENLQLLHKDCHSEITFNSL